MFVKIEQVRVVAIQPDKTVYADQVYDSVLEATEKFNYFCKIAKVNYPDKVVCLTQVGEGLTELTACFPLNEDNPFNQSGFVQVSMYMEQCNLRRDLIFK